MGISNIFGLRNDARAFASAVHAADDQIAALIGSADTVLPSAIHQADEARGAAHAIFTERIAPRADQIDELIGKGGSTPSIAKGFTDINGELLGGSHSSLSDAFAAGMQGKGDDVTNALHVAQAELSVLGRRADRAVELANEAAAPVTRNLIVGGAVAAAGAASFGVHLLTRGDDAEKSILDVPTDELPGGEMPDGEQPLPGKKVPVGEGPVDFGDDMIEEVPYNDFGEIPEVGADDLHYGEDYVVGINGQAPNGGFVPLSERARHYLEGRNDEPGSALTDGARPYHETMPLSDPKSGLTYGEDFVVGINGSAPNGGMIPLTDEARAYLEDRAGVEQPQSLSDGAFPSKG